MNKQKGDPTITSRLLDVPGEELVSHIFHIRIHDHLLLTVMSDAKGEIEISNVSIVTDETVDFMEAQIEESILDRVNGERVSVHGDDVRETLDEACAYLKALAAMSDESAQLVLQ